MPHTDTPPLPPQPGRTAVITGTGGIGLEAALALARAGAHVVLAGRNPARGATALRRIHGAVPDARAEFRELDLANLASIRRFGQDLAGSCAELDLLVNNAGVMAPPTRQLTADGFELQLGTNHFGHFALTAQLLPLLRRAPAARVVSVSSIAAQRGRIDFDNLHAQRHYRPMEVYSQSKLACLMFALELQRRSDAAGWGPAKPGGTSRRGPHRAAAQRCRRLEPARPGAPLPVVLVPAGGTRRMAQPDGRHRPAGRRRNLLRPGRLEPAARPGHPDPDTTPGAGPGRGGQAVVAIGAPDRLRISHGGKAA